MDHPLRTHKLIPADIDLPTLGSTEAVPASDKTIHLRFFATSGSAYWLLAEYDPESGIAFGFAEVVPGCGEWGSFSVAELSDLFVRPPCPVWIERDFFFTPKPFRCVTR